MAAGREMADRTPPMDVICLLLTTVDDAKVAQKLATGLVEARLAACVQVSAPMTSYYRWQGKQEQSAEYQLQIKLLPEQRDAALAWLEAHHPYQTPELVSLDAQADFRYVEWMQVEQRASNG